MWLLDHNVSLSIKSETAAYRGWASFRNGELVQAASAAGFACILTRDVEFAKAASKALRKYSNLAIVLIALPQSRGKQFCELFLSMWKTKPIQIKQGIVLKWPD